MKPKVTKQIKIHGTVATGFESVKDLFEKNMRTLAEESAQLCIYVGNSIVVDLWATNTANSSFTADTLVNIFSSGKSLEAIAVASLVDKGLVEYDAKGIKYWPEFGAHDKQSLTIAQLMRHEAGLAAFDVSIDPQDLLRENLKQNKIGNIIEMQKQRFRQGEGNTREYHAITRGWIINEVFRRADPSGRTLGEYIDEEIRSILEVDVVIGVEKNELCRTSKIMPIGIGTHLRESLKPAFLGRKVKDNFLQICGKVLRMIPAVRVSTTAGSPPPFTNMKSLQAFNEPDIMMGETSSANAHCSARGLAKTAAVMALGGSWNGHKLLSEQAWQALHAEPVKADMGLRTTFTQGGVALFSDIEAGATKLEKAANEGREGFYGWMGLGGSIFQWHPKEKIGFAFVPTSLHVLDFVNERGKEYQSEILRCLKHKNATS